MELLKQSIETIKYLIEQIEPIVNSLEGLELPKPVIDEIKSYQNQKIALDNAFKSNDESQVFEKIMYCSMYIHRVANNIKHQGIEVNLEVIEELINKGKELQKSIQNRPSTLNLGGKAEKDPNYQNFLKKMKNSEELSKTIESLSSEIQKVNERVRLENNENIDRINETKEKTKSLESEVKEIISKTQKQYDDAVLNISNQKDGLHKLISEKSGDKVAKSYEDSSATEKKSADILRGFSISFMILIAIIVGYSFWETTLQDFKWEHAAFRIVLAFFLTIPSAYLARESAKHREQQYLHLQKSLTIRAVDPYILQLPDETKHDIKKEVASYIFNNTKLETAKQDSFPINNQEVLMEIIKKLDLKFGENQKVNKPLKQDK